MSNRIAVAGVALLLVAGLPFAWAQEKPGTQPAPAAASQPAKVYACPMKCEGEKTYPGPGKCPKCGMDLQPVVKVDYSVGLKPAEGEIKPAAEVTLEGQLQDAAGKPVKEVPGVRELQLFVVFVSDDLSWLLSRRPEFDAEGRFTLKVTLPQPGKYHVYYEFPRGAVNPQVAPGELTVPGQAPAPVPLKSDTSVPKEIQGYTVKLQNDPSPVVGRELQLVFTVSRGVIRLATLEQYLGAPAQLFVVSQDLKQFFHAYPVDQPAGASSGPDIPFRVRFPTEGLWRGWYVFQHGGRVVATPFTFNVYGGKK